MAQIGTIKLETQSSGTVDVPVFETGDSSSDIYEFVRVETASGTGFIPVTSTDDAAYPYLRVQSQNNGIVAVTDTAGIDILDAAVDSFEQYSPGGDASLSDNYSGDLSSFQILTDSLHDDSSQSLEGDRGGSGDAKAIVSTSGLENYPQRGQSFSCLVKGASNNAQCAFGWGADGNGNRYELWVDPSENRIRIVKRDGGSTTTIDNTNVTIGGGTIYKGLVEWQSNDTMNATVTEYSSGSEVGSVSGSDGEYSGQTGISFWAGGSFDETSEFDWYLIENDSL